MQGSYFCHIKCRVVIWVQTFSMFRYELYIHWVIHIYTYTYLYIEGACVTCSKYAFCMRITSSWFTPVCSLKALWNISGLSHMHIIIRDSISINISFHIWIHTMTGATFSFLIFIGIICHHALSKEYTGWVHAVLVYSFSTVKISFQKAESINFLFFIK